tara:strand:- start:6 stop:146 length:141 start_codon:yes stop_codon:yes gene_type:complete
LGQIEIQGIVDYRNLEFILIWGNLKNIGLRIIRARLECEILARELL